MFEFISKSFVTLIVIIDPIAVVPMFIALTRNQTSEHKNKTAFKSCFIAAILLVSFAVLGDRLLDALSISEPAFRITGGFLLLLAGIEMVVAKKAHGGFHSTTGEEEKEAQHRDDISVFPLAIPLIAGPGALTSIVVIMRQAETISLEAQAWAFSILLLTILIVYVSLRLSNLVAKVLGVTGTNVLTRVFGIILCAVATQYMITGIKNVVYEIARTL